MIEGKIYNIMVGSPGDVKRYADIAIECIHHWNVLNTFSNCIALIPSHWSLNSFPSLEDSAQRVINKELVEGSDALVAIFGSRIGSPTKDYSSGTIEEIQKHIVAGKHVMVFFSETYPSDADFNQLKLLKDFKSSLEGLYETFKDETDFRQKFAEKLHLFVQNKLKEKSKGNNKEKIKVDFSPEEIEIIKKWTKSNSNYLSIHHFIGGKSGFSFGGLMYETSSPKGTAEMEDFINRLLEKGFIELNGFDSKGNAKYKLSLLGYNTFGES